MGEQDIATCLCIKPCGLIGTAQEPENCRIAESLPVLTKDERAAELFRFHLLDNAVTFDALRPIVDSRVDDWELSETVGAVRKVLRSANLHEA
jgi:hypothetical protein